MQRSLERKGERLMGPAPSAPSLAGVQPALWSREDVLHWLRWAEQEYSLQRTGERGFEMNGRALCILTKDDFRLRAPDSGQGNSLPPLEALSAQGGGRRAVGWRRMLTPARWFPLKQQRSHSGCCFQGSRGPSCPAVLPSPRPRSAPPISSARVSLHQREAWRRAEAAPREAGGRWRPALPGGALSRRPSRPPPGDVLYELLRYIRTQRQALVCGPFFGGAFRPKMPTQRCPCPLEGEEALLGGSETLP